MLKDEVTEKIVTRVAPSPTGNLHIGTARTALFNFLFARKVGGKLILRIEDTDQERSKKEYEDNIKDGLEWLGIKFDEHFRQSARVDIHRAYIEQLISADKAYSSKEQDKDGNETNIIRFRNPGGVVSFFDMLRGEIRTDVTDLGDFVIAKDMNRPLFHLVVVADDADMGITHVVRGDDLIASTPRQVLIQDALGVKRPLYAHIPLILAPDKSKLSKRDGAVALTEYRERGYMSDAMVNFLAFLGWHPDGEREVYSLSELIDIFSLERVQKGGAIFNEQKLKWYNREYIRMLSDDKKVSIIKQYLPDSVKKSSQYSNERLEKALPVILEKISHFSEIAQVGEGGEAGKEIHFFFSEPVYSVTLLVPPKEDISSDELYQIMSKVVDLLESVERERFSDDNIKDAIWQYATEKGRGKVLWPLRVALSGLKKSPDPFRIASILGKEETCGRIRTAIKKITTNS